MTLNEKKLIHALQAMMNAENRYKDGSSDERYTDSEIASRKRDARDNALQLLKEVK